MNKQQLVAQALISWLSENLAKEHDIAREGLPQFDVMYFLEKLGHVENFSAEDFSIALVGFGLNSVELTELANQYGLGGLRGISDDLHLAAEWRNNRAEYGRILALAKGRHPGVHTLMHFAKARSKELAKAVLQWAKEADDLFVMKDNQPQHHLLHELATSSELELLCSLEAVTAFLTAWADYRQTEPNDAPRKALPALGLFIDPQLLAGDNIAYRLLRNFELVDRIREMPAADLRDKRRRFARYQNVELRTKLLDILDRLEAFRVATQPEAGSCLTYEEVVQIVRPPADIPEPQEPVEEEEEDTFSEEDEEQQPQPKTFQETSTDVLLDNRQDALEELADACEEAWEDFEEKQGNDIEVQFEFDEIQQHERIPIDRRVLKWLETFCSEEVCGGFFVSNEVDLRLALNNHQNASPLILFSPNQQVFTKEGQKVSMRQLFAAWDEDLVEAGFPAPGLLLLWDRFFALRSELVKYVRHLIYTPLEWLPGRQEVVRIIEHYLELSTQIYSTVQERVKDMDDISRGWARATLEGLLSLDIIQVSIPLNDGRVAKKAVMLPTHPLHLWRYQRLVQILRGLGQSAELSDKDRRSIYADI